MNYKHLTAGDRGIIEGMLRANCKPSEIAKVLGVDPTTASREIKKRSTPNGYFANIAQLNYESKRRRCRQSKKLNYSPRQKYITDKLERGWSPETISGRLKLKGRFDLYVCAETIYDWLYSNDWAYREEKLYQYLRYGRKKRKKHTGRSKHRLKIPNRVSIHDRDQLVEHRVEIGHWEGDSVIYPHKYAINTLNELTTGLVRFTKLDRKTAKLTAVAIIKQLEKLPAKTLTVDNGTEFMEHEYITHQIGVKVYFADPYSSWQRGANENANMLLRGYLPKRCSIQDLAQTELDDIANELNHRPRKRLGFRTPNEVYQLMLQSKERSQAALGSRM